MLLIFKYLKKVLSFFSVIARLDRAIQRKVLDYPVEPDNDTIGTEFAMKGIGLKVLRFSDKEVFNNTQSVLEGIWGYL